MNVPTAFNGGAATLKSNVWVKNPLIFHKNAKINATNAIGDTLEKILSSFWSGEMKKIKNRKSEMIAGYEKRALLYNNANGKNFEK